MKDKISVITTVYNTHVDYLKECIDSVCNQTYSDHEHIIVDDGSTNEETIQYLKELSEYDCRIRVIFQETNKGIGASRNRGIEESTGVYICFLDSDDFFGQDHLEKLYEPVDKNPDCDMVVDGGYTLVDENGALIRKDDYRDLDDLVFYYSMPTGCRLIRKTILTGKGVYFTDTREIYEDNTFFTALTIEARNRRRIDNKGYINRVNQESYSHSDRYKKLEYKSIPTKYIRDEIVDRYKNYAQVSECEENIIISSCLVMLATCMLFFCRSSEHSKKDELIKKACKDIREIASSKYARYFGLWFEGMSEGFFKRLLYYGLAVSMTIRVEKPYLSVVHRLMAFSGQDK